jgi:hypothetical protein
MRAPVAIVILSALAACEGAPPDGGNPGLFEPRMFNDVPYNVSFVGTSTVDDPALVAQGYTLRKDIEVYRMTGSPFGPGDLPEAEAVAEDFCSGPTWAFVTSAENVRLEAGGYLFSGACLMPDA